MSDPKVIHAYRHLYRGLLRAVQFSRPASIVARDKLRTAFREEGAQLDARGVARTLRFLEAATRERGMEHEVLRTLLKTTYFRYYHERDSWKHALIEIEQPKKRCASPSCMSLNGEPLVLTISL